MKPLFEQYRPAVWADVIGQGKALARINAIRRRGLAGRAYWLTGQSANSPGGKEEFSSIHEAVAFER